jgi:divalent metal cation (Fe/Co/Zn/Cd) transporter
MNFTELDDDPEDPQHTPAERSAAASRSTWVSVGVNIVLSTTQIWVGVVAKSQGLIADGIHSLSDLVADFVVLIANHHSKKDADEDHPYGHHRYETAASLVLGMLLLAVGVGMLWSAFLKLENPETVQTVHIIALWVAAGALVAKELLFRYMLKVAKQVKSSMLVATPGTRVGRGVIAGGRHRHHRQPGRVPDPRPDRRPDRRLHGGKNGLGIWLGRDA